MKEWIWCNKCYICTQDVPLSNVFPIEFSSSYPLCSPCIFKVICQHVLAREKKLQSKIHSSSGILGVLFYFVFSVIRTQAIFRNTVKHWFQISYFSSFKKSLNVQRRFSCHFTWFVWYFNVSAKNHLLKYISRNNCIKTGTQTIIAVLLKFDTLVAFTQSIVSSHT